VHAYFATNWKIDPARFTFAAGSRVAGEGRVEFYIGSTLWLVSYVKPGRDIASTVVIIQTGDTMVRANAIIVVAWSLVTPPNKSLDRSAGNLSLSCLVRRRLNVIAAPGQL